MLPKLYFDAQPMMQFNPFRKSWLKTANHTTLASTHRKHQHGPHSNQNTSLRHPIMTESAYVSMNVSFYHRDAAVVEGD